MNPGIVQIVAAQFFLSTPHQARKTSQLAVQTLPDSNITTQWKDLEHDHNSLLTLKPSSNLELLVNQFNNATPENSNDPEKISIMTQRKCVTLKYAIKVSLYPYSI